MWRSGIYISWPIGIDRAVVGPAVASWVLVALGCFAQEYPSREELKTRADQVFGVPKDATALSKNGRIWVDAKRKLVIIDGYVTLTQGQLEMFACPVGTKEHEAVVAVFATSKEVHAALLAVGAKQGTPTRFEPYTPATGSTVKVHVLWRDAKNEKNVKPAQHWIRDVATNKEMPYDWVFAGSILAKDPDTGEEMYLGDAGDLLCVANFQTATLDIAVESAAANAGLVYSAYTERIPPLFTACRLVLQPTTDTPRKDPSLKIDPVPKSDDATSKSEVTGPAPTKPPDEKQRSLDDLFRMPNH